MPTYSRLAEGPRANHNAPRARVMPAEYALPGFAHNGKSLRQQGIQQFAIGVATAKLLRFGTQGVI